MRRRTGSAPAMPRMRSVIWWRRSRARSRNASCGGFEERPLRWCGSMERGVFRGSDASRRVADCGVDSVQQPLAFDGFLKVGGGAGSQGALAVLLGMPPRYDDHGQPHAHCCEPRLNGEAVELRHVQVEDETVWLVGLERGEELGSGG